MNKKIKLFTLVIIFLLGVFSVGYYAIAADEDYGEKYINHAETVNIYVTGESMTDAIDDDQELGGIFHYIDEVFESQLCFDGALQNCLQERDDTIKYTNNGGTSWSDVGNVSATSGGWTADATNFKMYPTNNASGYQYPVIIGTTATATPADGSTELYVSGGAVVTGDVHFYGGAFTFNDNSASVDARFETNGDAYGLMIDGSADKIGMGVADPGAKLEILSTTAQLWLSYDGSNAATFTVSSGGDLTLVPSGADMAITGDVAISATTTVGNGLTVDTDVLVAHTNGLVGINLIDSDSALEIEHTTAPLKLSYDSSNSCAFVVGSSGDGTYTCSGGDITFVNENLVTTGTFGAAATTLSDDLTVATPDFFVDNSADVVFIGTTTGATGADVRLQVWEGIGINDATSPYDQLFNFIDSSDDAVMNMYANNTIANLFHANGTSYITGGNVGIGTTTSVTAELSILSTTQQLRLAYDAANIATWTVGSGGDLTVAASGGDITFGDENLVTTGTLGAGTTTIGASDFTIDTNTFSVDADNNRVLIGTSTSDAIMAFDSDGSGTTTISLGKVCFRALEEDGTLVYWYFGVNGFASTTASCF